MTLDLDALPVIRAAHDSGQRPTAPTMVVIHTAENSEGSTAAEGVALFFAVDVPGRGSAQLSVDDDSAVRCLPDDVIPWAAGEGDANRVGLHVEISGRAGQTSGEWDDEFSRAALQNTADLVRQWCARYGIRAERITADRLRNGERGGICGHADYHDAYPVGDVRTDPGGEFPWARFLALVTQQDVLEEDDMAGDNVTFLVDGWTADAQGNPRTDEFGHAHLLTHGVLVPIYEHARLTALADPYNIPSFGISQAAFDQLRADLAAVAGRPSGGGGGGNSNSGGGG